MRTRVAIACILVAIALPAAAVDRIDHAGRILPALPVVTAPLQFHTDTADAVVSAMQIVPRDSAWVERVATLPFAGNSAAMIARIQADIAAKGAGRQNLRVFYEMNYVLVPDAQTRVDILFTDYPDESDDLKPGSSDVGSWPIPANVPVETWPRLRPSGEPVEAWQQNTIDEDRHAIIVMPGTGGLWETWHMLLTGSGWQAANGARFDLRTNDLRPDGWTSGDAAGLAMFPALVRYDECARGVIDHACRIIVGQSRNEHLYPASHHAGSTADANTPAMGQRVRLRAGFPIPTTWHAHSQAVARALKTYGAIVADNGGFFSISATPDPRFAASSFTGLQTIGIGEFEVVQGTGEFGGPRSPGAPTCDAGPDLVGTVGTPVPLVGSASGGGATTWYLYDREPQPGAAVFVGASLTTASATFSAAGTYDVMLRADDGVHTPAYDVVRVVVGAGGGTTGTGTTGSGTTGTGTTGGTTGSGTTTGGTTGTGTTSGSGTTGGGTAGGGGSSSSSGDVGCGRGGGGALFAVAVALAALRLRRS